METAELNRIAKRRMLQMDDTLDYKGIEYGGETDRLEDLRAIARVSGEPVGTVLKILWSKHIVSCFKMLDGKLETTQERIDEKCGDSSCYNVLGEVFLTEQMKLKKEMEDAMFGDMETYNRMRKR